MAAQSFNCPNCGAPLDYDNSGAATMRCPFCSTSVVVPESMRPHHEEEEDEPRISINFEQLSREPVNRAARPSHLGRWIAIIVLLVVGFSVAMTVIPIILVAQTTNQVLGGANEMKSALLTQVTDLTTPTPEDTPVPTPTTAPSPTPSIAQLTLTFGGKGIGQGLLNDARYIAVDGQGVVYVADYQGGRVQAFDGDGKYLRQWNVGKQDTIIFGLAANTKGEVFVSFNGNITRYDGATGDQLAVMKNPKGGEYGDMTVTADGGLAGVWYEGRWGIITGLDGHSDDLTLFNAKGKVAKTISAFISGQTDNPALDTEIAVDGSGTIYALSDGVIFKFSSAGKFLNRFGSSGDQPDQFSSPQTIAVDGQGRVYVGGSRKVWIFSPDGRFLDSFTTKGYVRMLTIDAQGAVWTVTGDQVMKYTVKMK